MKGAFHWFCIYPHIGISRKMLARMHWGMRVLYCRLVYLSSLARNLKPHLHNRARNSPCQLADISKAHSQFVILHFRRVNWIPGVEVFDSSVENHLSRKRVKTKNKAVDEWNVYTFASPLASPSTLHWKGEFPFVWFLPKTK